jgi:hypothetical protein
MLPATIKQTTTSAENHLCPIMRGLANVANHESSVMIWKNENKLLGRLPKRALPSTHDPPAGLLRYVREGSTSLVTRTDPMNPKTNQNTPEYRILAVTLENVLTN